MNIPDRYQFRYRLLASADIIGSTAFKTGQASQKQSWAHVFSGFFEDFPKELASCFEALPSDFISTGAKPEVCMDVWKLVGDEILFVAELSRHEEAAYHVVALKDALNRYSETLASKHRGLGLKGTVWGAGFPVMNVQVETQVAADGMKARDFLGPSVDLGFRLAGAADRRRMPISADVALFLRHARQGSADAAKRLQIFADSPQVLKGINAGGAYPMLWVDRLDGKETPEDRILGRVRKCDADALQEYLEEQFSAPSIGLMRPFIDTDSSAHFKAVPGEFVEWRKKLLLEDPDVRYSQDVDESDPSAANDAKVPPLPETPKRIKKKKKTRRS